MSCDINMYQIVLGILCLIIVGNCKDEVKYRIVELEDGKVYGEKYWDGDFYEFYGVPYATAPKGRDKFKAPLPVESWEGVFKADVNNVMCYQTYYTGEESTEIFVAGEEDCLLMNLMVPEVASEKNLVPVIVYIHSGAYSVGNGNMAKYYYLARHDVIVISFNFRLGAFGFACLGTEEIPGNAGMKDQVAALKWINKNIRKFGGDPEKVTLAGFSIGATMAELLALSKQTHGLIDKLVLESSSALAPYAINRAPISTAKNIAISIGYNGTGDVKSLTEFYLNAPVDKLVSKSLNFFLPNSTFGFAPCIEENHEYEPFLKESPLDIMENGDFPPVSVITGFASMEGISRALKFETWSKRMNDNNFDEFLPADLSFENNKIKNAIIKSVKEFYFKGKEVSMENIESYVDFFSDSMFKYNILKSAKLHAKHSKRPVYFYEFDYVGELNMQHQYMNVLKGASHRDQSSYILDFFAFTSKYDDMDMRDRMTSMWSDFIKFENPTAYESPVVDYKWLKFTNEDPNYLQINLKPIMKRNPIEKAYNFWNTLYEKYYWNPTKVKFNKK